MSNPKLKAEELVEKFKKYSYSNTSHDSDLFYRILQENAKQCALIAVNEILQSHYALLTGIKPSTYNYWQKVKEEIEKL